VDDLAEPDRVVYPKAGYEPSPFALSKTVVGENAIVGSDGQVASASSLVEGERPQIAAVALRFFRIRSQFQFARREIALLERGGADLVRPSLDKTGKTVENMHVPIHEY